jgi:hopene-associated glycosyltransferase HpnB
MLILEMISLAALAFWVLLTLDRPRSWPTEVILPDVDPDPAAVDPDTVVAVVPARNESKILPETLPSLLVQSVDGMRVVLVDDGSSDDTGQVARRLAEEVGCSHNLVVVEAGTRMEGWSGKVQALLRGYVTLVEDAVERGEELPEWLLLTDADIRHRPGSVRALLCQAHGQGSEGPFDLVSVMARLRAEGFWERLIVPAFVFFFQLLYPFRRVAHRRSRVAAAAGGCVLVRRSALEDAGGFAAISGEIIDDVALGRIIKRRGGRVWLGFDPGIVSMRAYPSLMDLWSMISRTAFNQLRYRWDLFVLTQVALTVFLVSPPLILSAGVVVAVNSELAEPGSLMRAMLWALAAWVLMGLAYKPAVRYHRVPSVWAASLPMASLLFGLMTAGSAVDHLRGRGPVWRGRSYGPSTGSGKSRVKHDR